MSIKPMEISGNWDKGYVLDEHVLSSQYIGDDVYGNPRFDTQRSELGNLIYELKYHQMYGNLNKIIVLIKDFLDNWTNLKEVDIVLPVPPSKERIYQPVFEIAYNIAKYLKVPYTNEVLYKNIPSQSKNMNLEEKQLITNTIVANKKATKEHNILLIDDLYQSGTTLNECVKVLREDEKLKKIYVLAMTRTKK